MTSRTSFIVLAAASMTFAVGCSNKPEIAEETLVISPDTLQSVADKRIVFAHQSVGGEILQGVETLAEQTQSTINIVETPELPADQSGIFHFKVGENGNPRGKIKEFVASMSQPAMSGADMALLKLCYIDFSESTDAKALAAEYIAALNELEQVQPRTRFIAMTAPLTTIQTGPKAWVKRVLGKHPAGYVVNARRQEFNEILRASIEPASLFDVARIEAENSTFDFGGKQIEALNPGLTYDGGHLNATAQTRIAAALLHFLAGTKAPNHEHPTGA
jgi:hypothetical protein